jgi:hypothetical protein
MRISSVYNTQGVPVVADGTKLHVSGQQFAANSTITFLLNNVPLDETQETQSDGSGNVTTDLAVTSAWKLGRGTLTAHDTSNVKTTSATEIDVVQQGRSGTPGPNGSPADNANFTIRLDLSGVPGYESSAPDSLTVTGHPDPAGGTVCAARDNGAPVSNSGSSYNLTGTYGCSGTYKDGEISYTEAMETATVVFSDGISCTLNAPQPQFLQITGTYTDQQEFSGNIVFYSIDVSMFTCSPAGSTGWFVGTTGNWTGTVSKS